jgi:23S rRNA (guanosine2251-2'-O)-methyltransferase
MLYGRNSVLEALTAGRRTFHRLLLANGIKEDQRIQALIGLAAAARIPISRVDKIEIDARTGGVNHQGVLLECGVYPYVDLADVLERPGSILALDHIQDPQNFGALLRAAEASGVAGVIMPSDRAADVTASVVNASAGAVEHLLIARVTNLTRALDAAKAAGRWAIGLDRGDDSVDLFSANLPLPAVLIVGSEGAGMSALVRKHCDLIAALPMVGKVDSLNAATAGSIALFEILRRERTMTS